MHAIPGDDTGLARIAAPKRGAGPVEPEPLLLLIGAVTLDAMRSENGRDLALEVDLGSILAVLASGRAHPQDETHHDRPETAVAAHEPTLARVSQDRDSLALMRRSGVVWQ